MVRAGRIGVALAVALVLLASTGLLLREGQASRDLLRPDDAAVLALGQKVYGAHCANCHGASGQGQSNWREPDASGLLPAPPHDDSGHTWHHPDALLLEITRRGMARALDRPGLASNMPAYEGVLSDAEIVAALSWIKSRWSPQVRARHDAVNAQARAALR